MTSWQKALVTPLLAKQPLSATGDRVGAVANAAGTLRSESELERKPEVSASTPDEALFHCDKPSGVPRGPAKSTASLTSQRHPGKFPSAREDGGVSGVSSSCGTRGGFLPRHDEALREPLVRRQGSHVSMHVVRSSASLFSSHGRGLGPQDALKKDSRGLCRGAAGNPRFPRLLPGTLGNFPGCL